MLSIIISMMLYDFLHNGLFITYFRPFFYLRIFLFRPFPVNRSQHTSLHTIEEEDIYRHLPDLARYRELEPIAICSCS